MHPLPTMENSPDYSPPHADASRPSLGFPLGTGLLLIIIFSLSGIFSCCYHWEKLRSLRRSFSESTGHPTAASTADIESSLTKPRLPFTDLKRTQNQSVSVLMPGDDVPKFIALPCSCQPPKTEKLAVNVQNPPPPPVKPPRMPVPLY